MSTFVESSSVHILGWRRISFDSQLWYHLWLTEPVVPPADKIKLLAASAIAVQIAKRPMNNQTHHQKLGTLEEKKVKFPGFSANC
jgi:hypothetical protein